MASEIDQKPIDSIIIDTGPLIRNTVSISTIIGSAEHLYTTPAIISEIRDAATRSRVETTLLPFLNIRTPTPASYEAVSAFARRTGDFAVLSRQDLGILALAYEIHFEKYGGTWGLRDEPGKEVNKRPGEEPEDEEEGWEQAGSQKRGNKKKKRRSRNTKPRVFEVTEFSDTEPQIKPSAPEDAATRDKVLPDGGEQIPGQNSTEVKSIPTDPEVQEESVQKDAAIEGLQTEPASSSETVSSASTIRQEGNAVDAGIPSTDAFIEKITPTQVQGIEQEVTHGAPAIQSTEETQSTENVEKGSSTLPLSEPPVDSAAPSTDSDDSDGDWITPSNLHKHQAKDNGNVPLSTVSKRMTVATMTTDYAMQNVLLQMNLKLLSPAMQRVRQIRSTIMRCHACFLTTHDTEKQFCPRCGGPTLRRVTCSTDSKGVFRIHLARNHQWNNRGNKYSVPKPVAGTANGKLRGNGGGQGGWGRDLVLAEDQKEYTRKVEEAKRSKARDLMDEDYLPGILTGDRGKTGGKPKVGAGRNINSRKRF